MPHVGLGQWRANGTPAWAARSWGSSRRNRGKRTLASAESAVRGKAGITWRSIALLLVANSGPTAPDLLHMDSPDVRR